MEQLEPGRGRVDLWAGLRGSIDRGAAGAGVDLEHRATERVALFSRGWIGAAWSPERGREVGADLLAGLRIRW